MTDNTLHLTVLCENSVAGPFGLIGEHGWAAHLDFSGTHILFDTGQGQGIINNSLTLDVDLRQLDAIILSHGHYDHTSGLPDVLKLTGEVNVYAHPHCFVNRYWQKDEECREIGIRFKQSYLESLGADFTFLRGFSHISDKVFVSGEVPRVTDFEPPDIHMKIRNTEGLWVQDQLLDDMSLIIDTREGLVVLLGCAHAGLINILTHVTKNLPGKKIHTVIGGTHLGFAGETQFNKTIAALEQFHVKQLGAGHCTGLENGARLSHILGENYFFSPVGTRLSFAMD